MSNQQQQDQAQQPAPKRLEGKVKSVLSGDTLVLAHPTKIFPAIEKVLTLVRIQAPRMAKRGEENEEPFAFEAREFLRKKCIGKLVSFQVEYRNADTKRDFGTVFLDGENLGEAVLREGLAKFKSSKSNEEFQNLADAQEEAKANKVGIWGEKPKPRHITWQIQDAEKLLKSFKGKTMNVIVEYVMNGSSMRVLLPTNEMVVVHLTGIQCPSIKIEEKKTGDKVERVEVGSMWSKEARHYTEVRVLHREVTMLFEGTDNNESLFGSILMGTNENSEEPLIYQEELLQRGLASIAEWNVARSKYTSRLRKAEAVAKGKKLRLWTNYEPPVATLKNEDMTVINAQVIEVLSGDTVKIRDEQGNEERISLSSIRAQRFLGKGKDAEPWAFEARDTLRKRVVGKTVQIKIDYRRSLKRTVNQPKMVNGQKQDVQTELSEDRRFGTIFINGNPLAVELVKSGYASVIKHKSDEERSIAYDQLMLAEADAKKKTRGLHGPKKNAPIHKITEIADAHAAKYLAGLKDKKIKAVVEKVFTGTRFKLLLPKESYSLTFAITGVSCPSMKPRDEKEPKPFAVESLNFAINQLMMRDVEIIIRNVDKVGSFVGDLLIGNTNFAVSILKAGYAMLQRAAEKANNYPELKDAEDSAKVVQKNVWSVDPNIFKTKKQKQFDEERATTPSTKFKIVKSKPFDVRVTEILDASHFYIQKADSIDDIEAVENFLAAVDPEGLERANQFEIGQPVLAYYEAEDAWFRAKVTKSLKDSVTVFYSDYGSSETLSASKLRVLPKNSELATIKPTVSEARLAFTYLHAENYVDDAKLLFADLVSGDKDLEATVEFTNNGIQYLTLVDKADDTNINQTLVRNGLVFVDSFYKKYDEFKSNYVNLEKDLQAAKQDKYYLWEDGDLYASDDEE